MNQLVALVLADTALLEVVESAWSKAGAPGVTVLHSHSVEEIKHRARRDDLPLFPSIRDLLETEELQHRLMFTVTDDDALVERLIRDTERIVGDLTQAGNGILFTIPLGRIVGLRRRG
jgi:hypothetical protein